MKPKRLQRNFIGSALTLAFSLPFITQPAMAASTWDGGGANNNWTTAANWAGDVVPPANDTLTFDGVTRLAAANDFTAATQFNGITFATSAGTFTLSGNSITLGGAIADNSINAQTISAPIILSANQTVDVGLRNGALTLNGLVTGNFTLTKTGSGLLTLGGGTNTFSNLIISGGTVAVATDANLGSTTGSINLNGGSLRLTAGITLATGRGITLGNAGGGNGTIDVNTGTVTYGGVIANNGGVGSLTKTGAGILFLTGGNTYTGTTTINQGQILLDKNTNAASGISSSSALVMGGNNTSISALTQNTNSPTLFSQGILNTATLQAFNGLTLNQGVSTLVSRSLGSGAATLSLGAITHNAGSVVNFSRLKGNAADVDSIITTTTANTNGILGGWATTSAVTVSGTATTATDWASRDGSGNIVAYTGYTVPTGAAPTLANNAASNVRIDGTSTGNVGLTFVSTVSDLNTIQVTDTVARTITIGAGNTLRLGPTGAIWKTAANGAALTISGGSITAGGAANTAGELILNGSATNSNTTSITVNSIVVNNGTGVVSLTKSGVSSIQISAGNTYTGNTYINQGRLAVSNGGATGGALGGNGTTAGSGTVFIQPSGQLYVTNVGTIVNNIVVAGMGTTEDASFGAIRFQGLTGNSTLGTSTSTITLAGDTRIGMNSAATNGFSVLAGKITGNYNLEFTSRANTNGGNIFVLSNTANDMGGNLGINAINLGAGQIATNNNNNTLQLQLGASEVIANGAGKGNVFIGGGVTAGQNGVLDMNGFNETINGLQSVGTAAQTRVTNGSATASTLTLGDGNASAAFGGIIQNGLGTLALTKIGTGTQTLTGANTFTGALTLSGGTLQIGDGTTDGTLATSSIINNATLAYNLLGNQTYSGIISGTGALTKSGASTLTLTGNNSYTGTTTINAGGLQLGNGTGGSFSSSAIFVNSGTTLGINLATAATVSGTISNNGTINLNGSNANTLSGAISGTGALNHTGTGTTILSGTSTYTGPTAISAGKLVITGSTTSNTTVTSGGTLGGSGTLTGSTTIATGGAIENTSTPGTLTLNSLSLGAGSSANLWVNGGVTPGTAALNVTGALSTSSQVTLNLTNTGTGWVNGLHNLITFNTYASGSVSDFQLTQPAISNRQVASLVQATNAIQLLIQGESLVWTGTSSGNWTTSATDNGSVTPTDWVGKLQPTKNLVFIAKDVVEFNDTATDKSVTIVGNVAPASVTFNNNTDYTLTGTGSIVDATSVDPSTSQTVLTKNGTGSLTIGTSNSYAGGTFINGGTLFTTSNSALGTGAVTINSGSLQINSTTQNNAITITNGGSLSGNGTVGATTVNSGTISNGNGGLRTPITFASLNFAGTGTGNLYLTGGMTTNQPAFIVNGALGTSGTVGSVTLNVDFASPTFSGESYQLISFGSFTGSINDFTLGTTTGLGVGQTGVLGSTGNAIVLLLSGGRVTWTGAGNGLWVTSATSAPGPGDSVNWKEESTGNPANFVASDQVIFDDTAQNFTVTVGGVDVQPSSVLFDNTTNDYTLTSTNLTSGITGTGALTKTGSGDLTILNANSYTGGTIITGGTVIAANNGAVGSGMVRVDDTAAQNATFQVNSGITLVNNVDLLNNGRLLGLGTIQGNVTNTSGIISPGINGIGTLTVNGNYTQGNNGVMLIDVNGNTNDQLSVGGIATLDGTLNVQAANQQLGQYYKYLGAGSIVGTFDQVTTNTTGVRARVINTATEGFILFAPGTYSSVAITPNQQQVAGALDQWIGITTGDIADVTLALDSLSAGEFPAAFDSISPAFHSGSLDILSSLSQSTASALQQNLHLRSLNSVDYSDPYAGDYLWDLWGQATGYYTDSGNLIPGGDFKSGTFLVGANRNFNHTTSFGFFAGYGDGSGSFASGNELEIERQILGGYLSYVSGDFYMNAAVGAASLKYDAKRRIQFGTLDRTADSSTDGEELFSEIGGGYDFHIGDFSFGPQAGLIYSKVKLDDFSETGADSLDLGLENAETTSLRSQLGARFAYTIQTEAPIALVPFVQTFWQHEYNDGQDKLNATLDGGNGPGFTYQPEQRSADSFVIGAGLSLDMGETFQATFSYNRDSGGDSSSDTISATANFKF